ncbi:MAG TPA: helix-turn-helix transcriptional regulator [Herpetosiphonaceae bacterium]
MIHDAHAATRVVGRRIAAVRQARRLSQAALAERLGWPRDTLAHYEYGRRALTIERLAAVAAALGVHPAALLVDDPALAALLTRLIDNVELWQQVAFFVDTLDAEI